MSGESPNYTSRSQTFKTYDALNRLTSAQNSGTNCAATTVNGAAEYWGNSYGYDAWGNLLQKSVTKCNAEHLSVTADAHNWIHASGTDYQYDAAGNMTFNASAPTQTYTYDQENRLTGAAGYTYTYDGDGNRVRKSNGTLAANGTLYWSMTPGVVAESDLAGTLKSEYVFFDGERVARRDGPTGAAGVFYYFSDHLKTASVITDSAGVIKAESDYYPWGGELQFVNNDSNDYKFTGKKRDTETGLDYFGARYYSNGLGRFVTPDWAAKPAAVPYAVLGDPQSLNLYTYVRNIPTTNVDPDGHLADYYDDKAKKIGTDGKNDGKNYVVFNKNDVKAIQNAGGNVTQTPASAVLQPGSDVKAAIGDAVKASDAPGGLNGSDKQGGFHEESLTYGLNAQGKEVPVPSQPGAYAPPGAPTASTSFIPKDQNLANSIVSPTGEAHVHPSGLKADGSPAWNQSTPSPADLKATMPGGTNIVVGAGNKTVVFYNSSGTIGTMSLKDFNKVP